MNDYNQLEQTPTISISPELTNTLFEKIILESGGVGLGIIIASIGFIWSAKSLGINRIIDKYLVKMDANTESLLNLSNTLYNIAEDLKFNHQDITNRQDEISFKITENNKIINGELRPGIKQIEKNIEKIDYKLSNHNYNYKDE